MKLMRGDMGGAATVAAATLAIAKLKLPVNLVTVCPLTENMPGPSATKPGDMCVPFPLVRARDTSDGPAVSMV